MRRLIITKPGFDRVCVAENYHLKYSTFGALEGECKDSYMLEKKKKKNLMGLSELKGVKKVRSAIKLFFFQFSKLTFNDINDSVSHSTGTYSKRNTQISFISITLQRKILINKN